jgi:hypothetical protein
MAQAKPFAGRGEVARDIAGPVVGHHARDRDSVAGVPGDEPSKEGGSGRGSFVGEDLGVCQTGSVVDGHVNELPSDTSCAHSAVACDAVADDLDASQLFGVDMNELSGVVSLVTADGFLRVEVFEPRKALPSQYAGHRSRARADARGDLGTGLPTSAQSEDLFDNVGMGPTRRTMGSRTAIDKRRLAALLMTTLPFRSGPAVNAGRLGGACHRDACLDALDQQHSTGRASSGILVKLHLGSFDDLLALDTSSLTDLGPDGQLLHGNNVLRNHS